MGGYATDRLPCILPLRYVADQMSDQKLESVRVEGDSPALRAPQHVVADHALLRVAELV
jgi:hypothetical protein